MITLSTISHCSSYLPTIIYAGCCTPPLTKSMIGVCVKHQTWLLLRRACQLCLRSRKNCITDQVDHSPLRLGAMARAGLHEYMPREAAESCFQDICVRRVRRVLSGRSTGEGTAVQRSGISAAWPNSYTSVCCCRRVMKNICKHMQADILLAYGPLTGRAADDDVAQ